MEFMLVFTEREDAPTMEPNPADDRTALVEELTRGGRLHTAAAATCSRGARVRVRDGETSMTDGLVVENGEIVSGFWIVEAADRAEAIALASRCLGTRSGAVEVHAVSWRETAASRDPGKPFLFIFRVEPGLTDADGSKLRAMKEFLLGALKHADKFVETAPLDRSVLAARVELRGGKPVVTDGPFAETKEGVGGYAIVRLTGYGAALELAKRFPHASWGPVEVREII